ncbi:hypothetical protein NA56DRAFT_602671 [Hyaloscypha hepaticicola]|uniref:Cora-domain-containing protein n=1 Tax=Hyaloscypha hepaticicola TaxID=2082293 RepID=A0A2J6Q0I1_9HELO|nr:hypothetical protein NA56DRAFT_602671 [Hyaloscypha hepaticicola]
MLSGTPAGSCEMVFVILRMGGDQQSDQSRIQIRPAYRVQDPTNKSELPFDSHTTLNLMRAMSLPLRWLSARGDDSGIFYSEVDGQNNRYLFQTPFYKEGSWTLTMNILRPAQALASLIDLVQVPRTTTIRTKTQSVRIVGMLEIDSSIDLASILDQVHFSALRLCHPFLLPMQLLEQHVEESARQFMAISQKLDAIEDSIDPSLSDKSFSPEAGGEYTSFGVLSKSVYECSNALYVLERRRDFESRFEKFLKVELDRRNEEENRRQAVNSPRDLGRRQLDYEFRYGLKGVYEEENTLDLHNWLDTIRETSGNRDLDMRALPRRIEALTSLIRNLVAQQDSQATIQIARSTMQENVQMTALTKSSVEIANQTKALGIATLKDSNAMKNIAVLTTVFLPGTYIASLFSTTMFNFAEDARYNVSRNIWIYFVITIPLTLVVFVGLQALIKYRELKGIEDRKDEEHGNK